MGHHIDCLLSLVVGAAVGALATLWFVRRPNTPISEAELDRRLADLRQADLAETPDERARREASLDSILASGEPGDAQPDEQDDQQHELDRPAAGDAERGTTSERGAADAIPDRTDR